MARARPAVTIATVTLCVGLVALAGCSGVSVDEEASPASTERSEATGRSRSSTAEVTSSTTATTVGTTAIGASTAGSSSSGTSSSPGTPSSPTTPTTPTTGEAEGADPQAVPIGFGQGTTGGAGGPTVTVSSAAALADAAAGDEPLVIEVVGTVALGGMVPVGSNKTVVGVAAPAGTAGTAGPAQLVGGGLSIDAAENVIVRNLTITGSGDDDIDIESSTDVWIDHNDLSGAAGGALDIERGADRITVSWNHFHDQGQNALVGHDDGNAAQDSGRLRVTYHHNWFDGTDQGNPRVRFGNPVHLFNNYYSHIASYGVASTTEAGVLVEANAFDDVENPFHLGDGDSPPGSLVARDNHMVASGEGQTGGRVAPIPYSYTPDPATSVESIVTTSAGPPSS